VIYNKLKNDSIELSALGFGCGPMGLYDYGEVDEKELFESVQIALDGGVTLFDTADTYGLGTSEKILGRALGVNRSRAKIASKFGVRKDSRGKTFYDNSPEWIEKALEGSLKRLNTDYLDLYQVHYFDQKVPLDLLFEILEKKCTEGKILSYGVSNLNELNTPLPPNLVSFTMEYSLCSRQHESIISSFIKDHNLNFISWGSLGEGILSGSYDKDTFFQENDRRRRKEYKNFHGNKLLHNLEIVSVMKSISIEIGKSLPQIAIRWILDTLKLNTSVLLGIKRPSDIEGALGAFGWELSKKQLEMLNSISKEGSPTTIFNKEKLNV
jgi:aryl-alcohol dehydrogenase-like predicted oxidoreductase